jgi:rhamnose transport system permease protein
MDLFGLLPAPVIALVGEIAAPLVALAALSMAAVAAGSARSSARPQRSFSSFFLRWEWLLVLLIILFGVLNSFLSPHFLKTQNLLRASRDFVEIGLMMLTMVFIIITAGIDLAVASTLAMTASFMGLLFNTGVNIWLAAGAALLLGIAAGAFNGFLISRVKLPPLVVTLGTYAFYRGMAYVMLGDQAARGYPEAFTFIGQGKLGDMRIPFSLVIFAVFALFFGLLLHKTAFGRMTYAIGNNEEACRYSGVPVARMKMIIYTMSGFMAAVAGIVLASRFGSTRPDIALGMELDVITTTVLGGVSISGGSGTMIGAVLSLILIGELRFGMGLLNIQGQVQGVIIGLLLIISILLPNLIQMVTRRGFAMSRRAWFGAVAGIAVLALFLWFFMWSRALYLTTL